mmetsp:Transcript_53420/g.148553  ORF Transcript_53420/g.148553 Transcript_53420/m.148553 type:complete len:95 (-) Transcript_53420:4-288(-)
MLWQEAAAAFPLAVFGAAPTVSTNALAQANGDEVPKPPSVPRLHAERNSQRLGAADNLKGPHQGLVFLPQRNFAPGPLLPSACDYEWLWIGIMT